MSADDRRGLTRRRFLEKSAATAAATSVAGAVATAPGQAAQRRGGRGPGGSRVPGSRDVVPLPSAKQVRADYQRMVDFGPRLPGYPEHNEFCDWIEDQLVKAGLQLLPSDEFRYRPWRPDPSSVSLEVGGTGYDPATVFVRTPGTPDEGVTGPLVNEGDGSADGSILLVELAVPGAMTAAMFLGMSSYWQWDGHTAEEVASEEFRRFAFSPWPASLQSYADQGAKAVVFIVDSTRDQLEDNYSPHQSMVQPLPAVVVDRDTGAELKARAASQPTARLRVKASWEDSHVRQITGILPGESDEVVIVNSHTDGQNAFEENGAVALVHLARHFASLRGSQKLKRTLVFVAWPGHMADVRDIPGDPNVLPEQYGWIPAHMDLFERAVGAVTIEHLGATRWTEYEEPEKGYHPTGEEEAYAIWTTQGPMQELCEEALIESRLQRVMLLKPPVQVTPGVAWHRNGIPHVAGIAAPTYLLVASENGEMDKLDPDLAARQTAYFADVIRRIDTADAVALRSNDPTLGDWPIREDISTRARSGPPRQVVFDAGGGRRLAVLVAGRRDRGRDVAVKVAALDGRLSGVVLEIYSDDALVGRSGPVTATRKPRRVLVRRRGHRGGYGSGTFTLVVSRGEVVLGQRNITLGRPRR
ncbi:MAG: hypothetical protein KJ006_01105 [Thermoleophilia bacterium]|nr:hypothetical protein [Thermoleophilia bacterium]